MRRLLSLLSLSTVLFAAAAAHADTYVLTFTDNTTGQVGVLRFKGVDDTRPGVANTVDITSLAPSTYGGNSVDLTFPTVPYTSDHQFFVDVNGGSGSLTLDNLLVLIPSAGTFPITGTGGILFFDGSNYYTIYDNHISQYNSSLDGQYMHDITYNSFDTIAATPEPSSMMLLGTGMLAVGGAFRRRFAR